MKTQALKGMRDLLPAEQTLRDYIQGKILETYRASGFERISTPMLEDMENLDKSDGGDNLAATFSPELVDGLIFVIDVGEGEKIPRKGGPGITKSDLLVINKIDIAPYVHSDLGVMERDTKTQRGDKPFVFTNLFDGTGLDEVIRWIKEDVLFEDQPLQE